MSPPAARGRVHPVLPAPRKSHAKSAIATRIFTRSVFDRGYLRIVSGFPRGLRGRPSRGLERACPGCFDPAFNRSSAKGSQCREHRASEPPARSHVTTATSGATCCVHWSSPSPVPPSAPSRPSSRRHNNCASSSAKSAAHAPHGHFPRPKNRPHCTLDPLMPFGSAHAPARRGTCAGRLGITFDPIGSSDPCMQGSAGRYMYRPGQGRMRPWRPNLFVWMFVQHDGRSSSRRGYP
jgi:hypothetical protein